MNAAMIAGMISVLKFARGDSGGPRSVFLLWSKIQQFVAVIVPGLIVLGLIVLGLGSLGTVDAQDEIDFARQIGPIFEQHCLRCHSAGVDKGDVSLATVADLIEAKHLVPGNPDGSYLIELVTGRDGERPAMPSDGEPLSAEAVSLLRRWIAGGANWPSEVVLREPSKADASWWAYQPLNQTRDSGSDLATNDAVKHKSIDGFIQARLTEQGLQPSPPADRATLIRRLKFDLHGLPPSPEEVAAFVTDPDPAAYEKLVDRLLDSPHYGERFARHWLDLAHYADTHGFERDQRRENAWRYRDYVIHALNDDLPYDRFLQQQIAGDVFWPDDEAAVIATGFLAVGPWDFVGQVETQSPELRRSARTLDLDDMATQVMTATMAMTVNCARCHDHKLDPITQREYYALQAVFAGVRRTDREIGGEISRRYQEQQQNLLSRRNEIDSELGRIEGSGLNLADLVGGGNGYGTGTLRNGIDPRSGTVQRADLGPLNDVVTNSFHASDFAAIVGVFIPNGQDEAARITVSSTGLTITGLPSTSENAWDSIRNGSVASQHSTELGGVDFAAAGHSLLGLHANAGITFDLAAIRLGLRGSVDESRSGEPLRFVARLGYFGAVGDYRADAWVFVDGVKVAEYRRLMRSDGLQELDIELPESARFLTLVATDGGDGYSMDQIGFGDPRVLLASPSDLSAEHQERLVQLRAERLQLQQQVIAAPPRFYGVVADEQLPEVRVLMRGDPESPHGEPLAPAAFSALAMLDAQLGTTSSDVGERRAALARWITHPDNPLTSRVIVNRLWQWHFGSGIVSTASDFGFGGGLPSHPQLLDWLAAELIRKKWSLKEMHRLIVTSETYRQSSGSGAATQATARQIDTDNRLLWRQNPRRIEAEAIRDAVLSVSGKLDLRPGGPGFEDFQ
ncbi:MAG: DUF1549 domain-containing protein [Pirellulaceae bacterium]|nr:DUF1549 domain-containing protein [Pirellulaceae bacterium]